MQVFTKKIRLFGISSLLLLGACASHQWPQENPFAKAEDVKFEEEILKKDRRAFRLVFSGNVNGETDPCGCALNPKGGLDRRLNFVRTIERYYPLSMPNLIVDAGNALFPTDEIHSSQEKTLKEKAEIIAKGHALMGVQAQNVGYRDLSAGVDFLKAAAAKEKLPLISANWTNDKGELLFEASKLITLGNGQKVLLVGLSAGFPSAKELPKGLKLKDPALALSEELAKAEKGVPVVLLSDMSLGENQDLLAKIKHPLIVVGSRDISSLEIPSYVGPSMIVQAQLQGQQWGVLELAWTDRAQGYYGVELGRRFQDLWAKKSQERDQLLAQAKGEERKREVASLNDFQDELLPFAPTHLEKRALYKYELVSMTARFVEPNELSSYVEQRK